MDQAVAERGLGWQLYFWSLSVLVLVLYLFTFTQGRAPLYCYFDVGVSLICLTGLYGYAYKRRLAVSRFWKLWFCFALLWDTFFNAILPGRLLLDPLNIVVLAAGGAMILPQYVALYLYGFRSERLWGR